MTLDDNALLFAKNTVEEQERELDKLAAAWMVGRQVQTAGRNVEPDQGWDRVLLAVDRIAKGRESFSFVAVERYRQYLRGLHQCLEGVARGRFNAHRNDRAGGQLAVVPARDDEMAQRLLFDLRQL